MSCHRYRKLFRRHAADTEIRFLAKTRTFRSAFQELFEAAPRRQVGLNVDAFGAVQALLFFVRRAIRSTLGNLHGAHAWRALGTIACASQKQEALVCLEIDIVFL